jgi:hypothetical protein
VNVAVDCPAGTVTFGGTVACDGLALARLTRRPPEAAGADSVTVPVDEAPRTTDEGLRRSEASVGGAGDVTVSKAVLLVSFSEPVMPATCVAVTADVVLVNVAEAAPAVTDTLQGPLATAEFALDSPTETPPAGAAALIVTVPVALEPPTTLEGLTPTAASETGVDGPGLQPS